MPQRAIDVVWRQEEADPATLTGRTAVVIDVLRATSTLAAALAAGATEAVCFRTVREVFQARRRRPGRSLLLCGERNGFPVRGFDLGNSPRSFTPERCAGRTLLMSTTNGTRAMGLARGARRILTACFLNLSAAARSIAEANGDVVLLCAGTKGRLSVDDVACAGALVERAADSFAPTDSAARALRLWRRARRSLRRFLLASEGGVNLAQAGLARDVRDCACLDRLPVVPEVIRRDDGFTLKSV